MNRRHFLQASTAAAAFLTLAACGKQLGRNLPSYRYRLTLEVDTPTGLKTGSSVIEVQTSVNGELSIPNPKSASRSYRGEAVAVEIAPRKTLFALLQGADTRMWAVVPPVPQSVIMASPDGDQYIRNKTLIDEILALKGVHAIEHYRAPANQWRKPETPNLDQWPMLVTFDDEKNPTSVKLVDPEDLAATFGDGVKLRRITVETTDDAVTTGIERRLGPLGILKDQGLDRSLGVTSNPTLAQQLGYSDFVRR
jgi:TAT (twin-arginine translocation) pathway signal sequence